MPNAAHITSAIRDMLYLQNALNRVIDKNWFYKKYLYTDAILVEAIELKEHYSNWKWWKAPSEPAYGQARIELIDIWHFMLSEFIQQQPHDLEDLSLPTEQSYLIDYAERIAYQLAPALNRAKGRTHVDLAEKHRYIHDCIRGMVRQAASGQLSFDMFAALMVELDLSFDMLVKTYITKNVLNLFRATHNYSGKQPNLPPYVKMWKTKDGNVVEDNEVLEQLMADQEGDTIDAHQLLAQLEAAYALNFDKIA